VTGEEPGRSPGSLTVTKQPLTRGTPTMGDNINGLFPASVQSEYALVE